MRRSLVVSLVFVFAISVVSLVATIAAGNSPQLGLDLQGGVSVVLQPRNSVSDSVLDQAIEIIRNRVDALGVAEPDISRQGSAVIVQLPGVRNRDRALELIGTTAQLYFRPVIQDLGPPPPPGVTTTTSSTSTSSTSSSTTVPGTNTTAVPTTVAGVPTTAGTDRPVSQSEGCESAFTTTTTTPESSTTTTVPVDPNATTPAEQDDPAKQVVLPEKDDNGNVSRRYLLGPSMVNGCALSDARATVEPNTGTWEVEFELTSQGTQDWNRMAVAVGQGNQIAIDLDGEVKSAPTLQETNFPGQGRITGNFSQREAKDLALVLRYGSLPVQLDRQTVQTVSASLGKDSLRAGMIAGLVGLGLVAIYMVVYYRALGLVVWIGLLVSGGIMYSLVALLGETTGLALTLAGATGIIVSVGVTVDSYVVYFERLKDEIRAGKTVRSSVDRSFGRAYRTILAADAASFIGAVVLYQLSVGSVRGFAFFLGLSTLLDVFMAYFFTRPMVILLGRNRLFTQARWLGVARGLNAESAGDDSMVKAGV